MDVYGAPSRHFSSKVGAWTLGCDFIREKPPSSAMTHIPTAEGHTHVSKAKNKNDSPITDLNGGPVPRQEKGTPVRGLGGKKGCLKGSSPGFEVDD